MTDITISKQAVQFSATTVHAKPATGKGSEFFRKFFGSGCCSVELRKSGLIDLERVAESHGLAVSVDMTWSGE